jgi:hypothetical protein
MVTQLSQRCFAGFRKMRLSGLRREFIYLRARRFFGWGFRGRIGAFDWREVKGVPVPAF